MTKYTLNWFILTFFLIISFSSNGQKVKYKDLFGLLNTKQYEPAEPFLKRYLKDNDDNPNAFLFMGVIYQEKSLKIDILKQTELAYQLIDSAIIFYNKAHATIDERELRRNKEYYEAYNRRDLRTGEFGVKLSDIQFDIEKKIQGLKERKDKIKMVKHYFTLSDSLYKKSNHLFNALKDQYPSRKHLYLRSDETTLKKLTSLSARFDSCVRSFETYKTASTNTGRTGYNQTLTLVDINDFPKDGQTPSDFYQDDLRVWDYKKFADQSKTVIENEVIPMRNHLVKYDIEINKLREKLNHDSVSVKSDLTKLIDVLLYEQLKKFDPEPLPMQVFSMKTADLEYRSTLIEHKPLKDSSDIGLQIELANVEMSYLNRLDSLATKLASEDIEEKALDYAYFITNTYSNSIVLNSYIKGLKEFAGRERRSKEARVAELSERRNWILDGKDSIPLDAVNAGSKFRPLHIVNEAYTVGIFYQDSTNIQAYLYDITPSRKPELKVRIPLDKHAFSAPMLTSAKAQTYADPGGHFYYLLVYNENGSENNFPATLAKVYRSDGLAWNNDILLTFLPREISFKPETSELTVRNESQAMVFDKNGKVLK